MPRPDVKALAALFDGQHLLTQCDRSESFYRLPGGNVELGETAAEALTRELAEEYGLAIVPGALLAIIENRAPRCAAQRRTARARPHRSRSRSLLALAHSSPLPLALR